jgi:hypothetical protein
MALAEPHKDQTRATWKTLHQTVTINIPNDPVDTSPSLWQYQSSTTFLTASIVADWGPMGHIEPLGTDAGFPDSMLAC